MGAVAFIRGHETDAVITMPAFVPKLVCTPYHFDIKRNRYGYWIARDSGGLAGGTFLTRKDAVHFALFEAGGDSAHVHTYPEAKAARINPPAEAISNPTASRPKGICPTRPITSRIS